MLALRNVLLLLCFLLAGGTAAASVEEDYLKARQAYQELRQSPDKQRFRHNWERVIQPFLDLAASHAGHDRAAGALYLAGQASRGLYEVSKVPGDARQAALHFESLADDYPDRSLADDGLVLAAEIYEETLEEPRRALELYRRALERYPGGDMAGRAKLGLERVARFLPGAPAEEAQPAPGTARGRLTGVRHWSNPGYTRVVLDLSEPIGYLANQLPAGGENDPRLYLDLDAAEIAPGLEASVKVEDGLLRQIRTGHPRPGVVRVVLDLFSYGDFKVFTLADPYRVVIDISGSGEAVLTARSSEVRAREPEREDRIAGILGQVPDEAPLKVRISESHSAQGMRRIVVDAGHGGKDPGAIGPSGLMEKEVTLAMAKRLARLLEKELGCEVILTRDDDTFLPLEERTAIANKVGADLFISLHANASNSRQAYGIETYYLNFSKNEQAVAVTARENGTSLREVGDLELILFDLMANSKINESSRLAAEIQKSLVAALERRFDDIRDLGVRQGPFYVLLGATMPSVLVETAFISNRREESRLTDRNYLDLACKGIVSGVRNYASALNLMARQ